jgi:predicted TPR repeat methyltransferase
MELYLDINKRDTDGMFLLASARYLTGDYDEAAKLYDRIIEITKDQKVKNQAELNKQQVMNEWYR